MSEQSNFFNSINRDRPYEILMDIDIKMILTRH